MNEPANVYQFPFQPRHPREENRNEIRRAVLASFPEDDPKELEEYADSLSLIAEAQDIPFECLRFWLHDRPAGKDFSLNAWRTWCARYDSARSQLPPEAAAPPAPPEPPAPQPPRCLYCYEPTIKQTDGRQWCPRCSEVQS